MANVDIKVFENISIKEKIVFEKFIENNWDNDVKSDILNFFDVPKLWVVGYRKDKIVGMFCVFDNDGVGEIARVVTRLDCRRQGVMSQMLQKFVSNYLAKYKFKFVITKVEVRKMGKLFGRVGFVATNVENEMKLA